MYNIGEEAGGFLGKLLGPLLIIGFPLMRNVLKLLAKSILMALGLTAYFIGFGMSPSNLAKQTILIISNEEMNDTVKIFKSLEQSGLLIKGVSETFENEAKLCY